MDREQRADRRKTARRARQRAGRRAEFLAACFLRLKGYRVLARNWRHPVGEIDLIAKRGRTLVFAEIKARPTPAQAVDALRPRQRQRIVRAAQAWLAHHPSCANMQIRFDLITIAPRRWPQHSKAAWSASPQS